MKYQLLAYLVASESKLQLWTVKYGRQESVESLLEDYQVCFIVRFTLMCLSIGTPKIINFPFVPNGKFIILRCPKIRANYILIKMCSIIGTPNNHHFPFGTNGKVVVLGVPILKHFRVSQEVLKY